MKNSQKFINKNQHLAQNEEQKKRKFNYIVLCLIFIIMLLVSLLLLMIFRYIIVLQLKETTIILPNLPEIPTIIASQTDLLYERFIIRLSQYFGNTWIKNILNIYKITKYLLHKAHTDSLPKSKQRLDIEIYLQTLQTDLLSQHDFLNKFDFKYPYIFELFDFGSYNTWTGSTQIVQIANADVNSLFTFETYFEIKTQQAKLLLQQTQLKQEYTNSIFTDFLNATDNAQTLFFEKYLEAEGLLLLSSYFHTFFLMLGWVFYTYFLLIWLYLKNKLAKTPNLHPITLLVRFLLCIKIQKFFFRLAFVAFFYPFTLFSIISIIVA